MSLMKTVTLTMSSIPPPASWTTVFTCSSTVCVWSFTSPLQPHFLLRPSRCTRQLTNTSSPRDFDVSFGVGHDLEIELVVNPPVSLGPLAFGLLAKLLHLLWRAPSILSRLQGWLGFIRKNVSVTGFHLFRDVLPDAGHIIDLIWQLS